MKLNLISYLQLQAWPIPAAFLQFQVRSATHEKRRTSPLTNTMVMLEHHACAFLLLSRSSRASRPYFRAFTPGGLNSRRRFGVELETHAKKPYYVTSPIFYVNA